MSKAERLREFVSERLTAAAEEIFRVFEKTIVEYEEEIDRQRRLLDIVWKPHVKLHRTELPQQHVCKQKEVLSEQQLCNQERNSSLDQDDPEPPQIKEEQEELCTSQEGEELVLKQETDTFMMIPPYEESDHSEQNRTEANRDQQLLSHSSVVAESQDQEGSKHVESGSSTHAQPNPKMRHQENINHMNSEDKSSDTHCINQADKKSLECDFCGKAFKIKYSLNKHLRVHTGEKAYLCSICGEGFNEWSKFKMHMKTIHAVEKPYLCNTCGDRFYQMSHLKSHMKVHRHEETYIKTYGRPFRLYLNMRRAHTELPQQQVLSEQQLCNQERNSSLDQDDPEPPQIKEEQEELCTSQEGEQLVLKQETDAFMMIPPYEESDHSEQNRTEANRDQQLLSHSSAVAESQDQEGSKHAESGSSTHAQPNPKMRHQDLGSTGNAESMLKKRRHENTSDSNNVEDSPVSDTQCDSKTGKESLKCDCCGKVFWTKSKLNMHLRDHTGEKPHVCKTCGKRFKDWSQLRRHILMHKSEKLYLCNICGDQFNNQSKLNRHMIMHTGDRPYSCETCSKRFKDTSALNAHLKIHSSERPYLCNTCGRTFYRMTHLRSHMKVHTR